MIKRLFLFVSLASLFVTCKKDDPDPIVTGPHTEPRIIFTFRFDSTQVRLDNLGNPSTVPAGHSALSPVFNKISAHYIELAPSMYTALGGGDIIWHAPETTVVSLPAIDFDSSRVVTEGQEAYSVPLSQVDPGTYNFLRVSLAYQNYNIKVRANSIDFTGTLASFIGYRTYIRTFTPSTVPVAINGTRDQGFWAFEAFSQITQGQAPPGATTVPNPIWATSPIPQGSCVVTASFSQPLVITGNETGDIHITISLSTNKSFEWVEHSTPDIYEPLNGDTVVDMGIRGMIPVVQ